MQDLLKSKFKVNWDKKAGDDKQIDIFSGPSQIIFGVLLKLDAED